MYIHETELSKDSQIPKQLELLQAANRRGLLRTQKEVSLFRNLEAGAQGEQFVLEALKKYGRKHWIVLPNLWQEYFGTYEHDILLLVNTTFYTLEVKNYDGRFEYKNDRCYINGKKSKENCIHQAEKSYMNLQEICQGIDRSITVKGALLFVGEHNEVQIQSQVDGIEVIVKNNLRDFVLEIAREEDNNYHQIIDSKKALAHFEKNEVQNPFMPKKGYSAEKVLSGKLGIYCAACGNFELEKTRKFVKCRCGCVELRRDAVLRMIEEYRVLTFDQPFTTRRELQQFMGGGISKAFLVDILNNHFVKVQSGKHAKYTAPL